MSSANDSLEEKGKILHTIKNMQVMAGDYDFWVQTDRMIYRLEYMQCMLNKNISPKTKGLRVNRDEAMRAIQTRQDEGHVESQQNKHGTEIMA
jgi:hypothetical protein